jgi:hypothetical protein
MPNATTATNPRPASQYTIADVQRMRPLVHRDLMALDRTLVFVKTHNARLPVAGVPLITPQVTAGAVYIVRDPHDIAFSYSRHLGRSIDATIDRMADPEAATGVSDTLVYECHGSWSLHVQSWTQPPDRLVRVLQYEALLAAPEAGFAALIAWLGQPPPVHRLQRAIRFSAIQELRAQEQAKGFVERVAASTGAFFGPGQPGRWRTVLSPAQRARIERDHGAAMARFGYA